MAPKTTTTKASTAGPSPTSTATSPKAAAAAAAAADGIPAATVEENVAELQGLASQARQDGKWTGETVVLYLRCASLLTMLGVFSTLSQLALSPVYGSMAASVHHPRVVNAACFVGWSTNVFLRRTLRRFRLPSTTQMLPIVAAYTPAVQAVLYGFSGTLGAAYGPVVSEVLTLFPLTVLTASSAADLLEGPLRLEPGRMQWLTDATPGIVSWLLVHVVEGVAAEWVPRYLGASVVLSRVSLEFLAAAVYAVLFPSVWLVLVLPAAVHTAVVNPHLMTSAATASLNSTLIADGWALIDRRESLTGYVSVLESLQRGFRVMRCDHSLLGGQWIMPGAVHVAEPIYAVFAMLEAVRLVESSARLADEDASALVVGLGIGTTPSALVAHGIDTTVVEIDPVVYEFASRYFDLRENNAVVLSDAVGYTAGLVEVGKKFDYIVHDVFTGGAEPADLFTLEFLQGLSDLLNPDGVIAIVSMLPKTVREHAHAMPRRQLTRDGEKNYAGDLSLPTPRIIVRTITRVFPTCRIFRESPAEEGLAAGDTDFTNMVIFCTKTATDGELRFRRATEADYLESHSRRMFLEPQHEVRLLDFLADRGDEGDANAGVRKGKKGKKAEGAGILRRGETEKIAKWNTASAIGHWAIMRTVLPDQVWELW
ncbi:Spermidine synthase [Geosmithia morbida]|uniref:Spermidine synthase n=1 Tax=Geosmithia morbida TaxID=1094350 RepID=A0A9P4YWF8_9HYPO|nr:Spermidine synthase [Geosmithia morbida]KAF4124358.1 Spermidine synthase [Geosmithia morbida]